MQWTRRRSFYLVVLIAGVVAMLCQAPSVYKIVQAVVTQRDVYSSFNDDDVITTYVHPSDYRGSPFVERTLLYLLPGVVLVGFGAFGVKLDGQFP